MITPRPFSRLLKQWRQSRGLSLETSKASPRALRLILMQTEPFGAVALDRRWDIVVANAAFARVVGALGLDKLAPLELLAPPRVNALELRLAEGGLRRHIADWPEVLRAVVAVELRVGPLALRLFSMVTTLGTARDVALDELRIESFHAADAAPEQLLRGMSP
jgi:transcription regulator MmyB-like protein